MKLEDVKQGKQYYCLGFREHELSVHLLTVVSVTETECVMNNQWFFIKENVERAMFETKEQAIQGVKDFYAYHIDHYQKVVKDLKAKQKIILKEFK